MYAVSRSELRPENHRRSERLLRSLVRPGLPPAACETLLASGCAMAACAILERLLRSLVRL